MSTTFEKKEEMLNTDLGEKRSLSISISGTDRKAINRFSEEFHEFTMNFDSSAKKPIILPTEEAVFTTRKSPCGNGTATFSKHTMRVYQRKFDMDVHDKNITQILEYLKNSSMDAQVKMNS